MAQRPISTFTIPEDGKPDVVLEIMREEGKDSDWHNRYARDPDSKAILYYCARDPNSDPKNGNLTIHRGGKDGPVIATTVPCEERKLKCDIHFVDTKLPVIPLHHRHHEHHEHHFCVNSKWFHFGHHHHHHQKQQQQQKEPDKPDKDTVATYLPSIFEGSYKDVIGKLHITLQEIQDLVVTTVLVSQEREEEKRPPAAMYFKRVNEMSAKG